MTRTILILIAALAAGSCAVTPVAEPSLPTVDYAGPDNPWFEGGRDALARTLGARKRPVRARNVILFIGDGMSLDTVGAARIMAGQDSGGTGEEHWLAFERLPHTALMKTYNTDLQVPDSAGTATAMMTGVKTKAGVIGVDENVRIGNCASTEPNRLTSFLEQMEARGKATGVVSTARITHATPAAAYAHSPSRNWESDAAIPEAERACADIARQLIEFEGDSGLEVALGGGRVAFFDATIADPEYTSRGGVRSDGRNLVQEWLDRHGDGARFVWNRAQARAIDTRRTTHVLGLFEPSHMQYEVDRLAERNEPSLAEMTRLAIDVLARDRDGYFLMVEGGRIDHAHHEGNAARALRDTIAFDDAIAAALARVDLDETLVIVTADHGHTLTFSGYPVRGNPILGKVVTRKMGAEDDHIPATDRDGLPYTTLGYANGPGYRDSEVGTRPDLTEVDTSDVDFLQEATVPLHAETHSGTDVIVYADGPGAQLFRGVQEQNYVYHVMRYAVGEP